MAALKNKTVVITGVVDGRASGSPLLCSEWSAPGPSAGRSGHGGSGGGVGGRGTSAGGPPSRAAPDCAGRAGFDGGAAFDAGGLAYGGFGGGAVRVFARSVTLDGEVWLDGGDGAGVDVGSGGGGGGGFLLDVCETLAGVGHVSAVGGAGGAAVLPGGGGGGGSVFVRMPVPPVVLPFTVDLRGGGGLNDGSAGWTWIMDEACSAPWW